MVPTVSFLLGGSTTSQVTGSLKTSGSGRGSPQRPPQRNTSAVRVIAIAEVLVIWFPLVRSRLPVASDLVILGAL